MCSSEIQQAEQRYIDSMLGVLMDELGEAQQAPADEDRSANHSTAEQAALTAAVDARVAPQADDTPAQQTAAPGAASAPACEPVADADTDLENLYQLIGVAGLQLAVPVTAISRVEPGSLSNREGDTLLSMDGRYRIVDLAGFIAAGRTTEPVEHYLLIEAYGYAIACGELLQMETLEPASLCRRSASSKRIWLAATAGARQIAVLDLAGIQQILNTEHDEERGDLR